MCIATNQSDDKPTPGCGKPRWRDAETEDESVPGWAPAGFRLKVAIGKGQNEAVREVMDEAVRASD